MRVLSHFKSLTIICLFFISLQAKSQGDKYSLWYKSPAEKWTDALPLGNGRIGIMVFGGVEKERIQFNEETVWNGEPRDYNRKGANQYLAEIRQLLTDGKQQEAELLAQEHFLGMRANEGKTQADWLKDMRALKGLDGDPTIVNYNDSNWKTMQVPASQGWEAAGLEELDGAVWFRTTFDLPKSWIKKDVLLDLSHVHDNDYTYVNGKIVGSTEGADKSRKYTIPKGVLKAGKNTLAIQVINVKGKGGITGYDDPAKAIALYQQGSNKNGINLNGLWKYKIQSYQPNPTGGFQASYQPFGDLFLNFNYGNAPVSAYRRELHLNDATAKTSFSANGTTYTREYFVSQPNQAAVIHLTASKPGSISFESVLSSPHKYYSVDKIDNNTVALSFIQRSGAVRGESQLRIETGKGRVSIENGTIKVEGADEATLYLTAGTNYVNYKDISGNPADACQKALASLKGKSYQEVRQAHTKEYQQHYNTFSIKLGKDDNEALPTDERLARFGDSNDPAFAALYVQYGRYLLISSSRPGTRPANLQGIWNELLSPPWGSKYTTNINLPMNYWPAEPLNLSAEHQPLFLMIKELEENGTETAKEYYNARGWVLHHNTDLWRGTAPINKSNHGIWVTGGAWLAHHLWEHYLFTQDKEFLAKIGYPLMKNAALFFVDFLVKDPKTGYMISTPSNSPESGGLVAGPTMDHQIIRSLFKSCIEASEILGTDAALRDTLKTKLNQIAPHQIGKHGQLQEWMEDKDDPKYTHRHVSHLWAVYPGNELTWEETPELMKAARQSLLYRGDGGTGWSLAWKINFWARFKDGEHAYKMVENLLRPATDENDKERGGSYVNLFDAHPPFQIDGNFGGAAGIAEMLVQSHTDYIELLPAMPKAFKDGSIKGMKARGGFELDMTWADGKVTSLEVLSAAGNTCKLKFNGKQQELKTEKGKRLKVI